MAVATTCGVVDTEDRLADEKPVDMAERIAMLDTDTVPVHDDAQQAALEPAKQVKVNWLEDQYFPRASKSTGTLTNVATTVNVTAGEGAYFRPGGRRAHRGDGREVPRRLDRGRRPDRRSWSRWSRRNRHHHRHG